MELESKVEKNIKQTTATTLEPDKLNTEDLNNLRAEIDAKLKQPLTDLQKIDKKQTQLTNSLQKLENESANSNIIANNFILSNFIDLFIGAVHCPNFNAYKKKNSNISYSLNQKKYF